MIRAILFSLALAFSPLLHAKDINGSLDVFDTLSVGSPGYAGTGQLYVQGSGNTSAPEHNILKLDNSAGDVLLVRGDGYVDLPNTTNASKTGIISKGGVPFIHNFNYGNNGTVTTQGANIFIGENAGNFTMGSTATSVAHASQNTAQGVYSLFSNTTGYSNNSQGFYSLFSNTTGFQNNGQGVSALFSNTTGFQNNGQGVGALYANTTGFQNNGQGVYSLFSNTTGNYNNAQGFFAGSYIADGTTALTITNQGVFLGAYTKALADNSLNEIVIGYNATGLGSNTAVIGNDSIVKTQLKGDVGIGTPTPITNLTVAGGQAWSYAAKTANYQMLEGDYAIFVDSGAVASTVTLRSLVNAATATLGQVVEICNDAELGEADLTIDGSGAETIRELTATSASILVAPGGCRKLMARTDSWRVH